MLTIRDVGPRPPPSRSRPLRRTSESPPRPRFAELPGDAGPGSSGHDPHLRELLHRVVPRGHAALLLGLLVHHREHHDPPPSTVTSTATATVTPACTNPQTCGSFQTNLCPGSSTQLCYCVKDTLGVPMCVQLGVTQSCSSFTKCASNADCTGGTACSTDWCCGYGICMAITTPASCLNELNVRSIFAARRQRARDAIAVAAAEEDEDEGEVAPAAANVEPAAVSVLMCPYGPCGATTVTASTIPAPFAARGR
ncbi:uncharacterized protein PG986_008645 [Apiospora aurea]|uniref:Uncharacterized protein n=1 Tax=Apiospora aurea TaxID=335848 RepID=A0ABR1Q5W2_9PEZI